MTNFKRIIISGVVVASISACSKANFVQPMNNNVALELPKSWYGMPEDQIEKQNKLEAFQSNSSADSSSAQEKELAPSVEKIFSVTQSTVEKANINSSQVSDRPEGVPADWTPWHLEYFATDLAVTASGKVGVLTVMGMPSVQAFWRRQNNTISEAPMVAAESKTPQENPQQNPMTLSVRAGETPEEIAKQVEPMVQAAAATGKIDDVGMLRENLSSSAFQFSQLARVIETTAQDSPDAQWWPARFRLDVLVSASGKFAPIGTVGGAVRLRLEWQRIMKDMASSAVQKAFVLVPGPCPVNSGPNCDNAVLSENLRNFIHGMRSDLESIAAEDPYSQFGIYTYQIRIGIGITANGKIGVAKGAATVIGHMYFSKDVAKPKVHPVPPAEEMTPVMLVENQPKSSHVDFARVNGIPMESEFDQVVYHVDRSKFREGLKKAFKIGTFFADRARNSTSRTWKLFQMINGFDMSITGRLGLVNMGGYASAEIDVYNGNF